MFFTTNDIVNSLSKVRARIMAFSAIALIALLLSGCGKGPSSKATDPAVAAQLANLTRELHYTMIGRKINRNFDEFVALSKVEVPPPPPGTQYAISENWKVILVDR